LKHKDKNTINTASKFKKFSRAIALIAVALITFFILNLPPAKIEQMESWGYPGIFIMSFLANATLLLPAPGLLFVFAIAARFPVAKVALFSGLGATLGELSGYLAGFGGQGVISNSDLYQKMVDWTEKRGPIAVMVFAFIPNPFFDLTGMAAGALKMPIRTFLLWAFIGKYFKMYLTALAGAGFFSAPWISTIFS
jgi:membrane protein YqaA with SNARE-associated domain